MAVLQVVHWLERHGLVEAAILSDAQVLSSTLQPEYVFPNHVSRGARAPDYSDSVKNALVLDRREYQSARCGPIKRSNPVRHTLALRWFHCLCGMQRAERSLRAGREYAWVVRTRPDYVFTCEMLPPQFGVVATRHAIEENDFLAIFGRRLATQVLSIGKYFKLDRTGRRWSAGACEPSCNEHSDCFDYAVRIAGGISHSTCWNRTGDPKTCVDKGASLTNRAGWSGLPPINRAPPTTKSSLSTCFPEIRRACSRQLHSCWDIAERGSLYSLLF